MTAPATTPRIHIHSLSKTFPGQRALVDVSIDIASNEIHALVGENGSGKSTLIKALAGYHIPDPGSSIDVDGAVLPLGDPLESRNAGLRFVHQDLGLVEEFTAAENVGVSSGFLRNKLGTIDWARHRAHTRRLLERIGVSIDIDVPVAKLRPVDRSAVAIATALDESQGSIKLLVLDEPTAALPPAEVEKLYAVVEEVRAAGASVLYVSHRLQEILRLADRISVLRDGHCQGTFEAKSVSHDQLIELIVGSKVAAPVRSELSAQARAAGPASSPASPVTIEGNAPAIRVRGLMSSRLSRIDLDLIPGEVLGVAGLTGSGREELAAALTGASPASMTLTLADGTQWDSLNPRRARRLGIVLALANRHPASSIRELTMGENITLARLAAYRRSGRVNLGQERSAAMHWVEELDIRPRDPDRTYKLLSGGNQQKTIIARWLNTEPTVMIMDDPTSGVDVGARKAIYDIIRQRCRSGLSVVVCSSDMEDFMGVCDRVVALVRGQIVRTLSGDQITEPNLLAAITGTGGPA